MLTSQFTFFIEGVSLLDPLADPLFSAQLRFSSDPADMEEVRRYARRMIRIYYSQHPEIHTWRLVAHSINYDFSFRVFIYDFKF
uniref:Uncharacterized protein n=1 Tax=Dulem virus 212 TaxID=3145689 RepID=A0AAU8B630_9VIRU